MKSHAQRPGRARHFGQDYYNRTTLVRHETGEVFSNTTEAEGRFRRPSRRTLAFLAGTLLIICLVWGYSYDRLSPSKWGIPINYQGDTLEVMAFVKAASEFDYIPCLSQNVSRLGAPFKANWDDNPMYEPFATFFIGMLSRLFGLFTGANLGILLSHLTAAMAFFICCRLLRYRVEWACMGALLFGLSYYNIFCTQGGHWLLAFTYTVPFALLTCWLVGSSRRLKIWSGTFWLCVASGFVIGTGNPYNFNMFLQLLSLAIAGHYFSGKWRPDNLQCGVATLAAAVFGFVLVNAHTLFYWMAHGHNPGPVPRTYREAERFALRPLELILPPDTERFAWLSAIGRHYSGLTTPHENHSAYLGIIGGISLLWLVLEAFRRLARRRPGATPRTAHAAQVGWVLVWAVVAGGNCLLAFLGILYFRGGNRYSIFIEAIVLFFLVSKMSLLARQWKNWSYLAAAMVSLVGLLDQLPAPEPASTAVISKKLQSEREFARALESRLPAGAMIYQFPEIGFPEGHPVNKMGEYEFIRPYLFTKALRFSFGFNDGRPREQWQHEMGELLASQRLALLEAYGFSGVFINRKAFPDKGEEVLRLWASLGRNALIEDDLREQVCILLNPAPAPVLPRYDQYALVVLKSGWVGYETMWHTSAGSATAYFVNEGRAGRDFAISLLVGSETGHHVVMSINGKAKWSDTLHAGTVQSVYISSVRARHGRNEILFEADSSESGGLVAFGVANLKAVANVNPR